MRLGPEDAFHLAYCTNIHPGESWAEVAEQLRTHVPVLKQRLAPDRRFGIGLRLSDRASRELLEDDRLDRFRGWLENAECYVFTINGFPYGRFHGERVKDQVYRPDWREPERVDYTVRLARILAELLPDGVDGSISTSPISYKPWLEEERKEYGPVMDRASRHLSEVVGELARIEEEDGTEIHLGLEPEPDCLIENTDETIRFFEDHLDPVAGPRLAERLHCSRTEANALVRRHVGVCYDTCHFAVQYEEASEVLEAFEDAEIRISKVQLSSALRSGWDDERTVEGSEPELARSRVRERLRPFAEDTYLHQVVARRADGSLRRYRDLGPALKTPIRSDEREWRIHYHVPLFVDRYDGLGSTRSAVSEALAELRRSPALCTHLEIETYTWSVLPDELRRSVDRSIEREYEWVLGRLESRGGVPRVETG